MGLAALFVDDSGDEENDNSADTSNLPDLQYKSKNAPAPVFEVLEDPQDTWKKIVDDIKTALVNLGHDCAIIVKGKERVRFDLPCCLS